MVTYQPFFLKKIIYTATIVYHNIFHLYFSLLYMLINSTTHQTNHAHQLQFYSSCLENALDVLAL